MLLLGQKAKKAVSLRRCFLHSMTLFPLLPLNWLKHARFQAVTLKLEHWNAQENLQERVQDSLQVPALRMPYALNTEILTGVLSRGKSKVGRLSRYRPLIMYRVAPPCRIRPVISVNLRLLELLVRAWVAAYRS